MNSARIELIGIRDGWRAGQYAFLRCFSIGWGSHPFTMASAGRSISILKTRSMIFLTKSAGDWTIQLQHSADAEMSRVGLEASSDVDLEKRALNVTQMSIPMLYEGPYGGLGTLVLGDTPAVLLCAGGSGISFVVSLVDELIGQIVEGSAATKTIWIVWSIHDLSQLAWIEERLTDLLLAVKDNNVHFRLFLHCSKAESQACGSPTLEHYLHRHRANYLDLVSRFGALALF